MWFMVAIRDFEFVAATQEPPREGTRPTTCRLGPPTRGFIVPMREHKTAEATHESALLRITDPRSGPRREAQRFVVPICNGLPNVQRINTAPYREY